MQEDTVPTGLAPQPQRAPPPGHLEDTPLGAAGFVLRDCIIEQFFKHSKQLLGLGQYQDRPYRAAVTHLYLLCFANALLTHLSLARIRAQGQPTLDKAAKLSTAATQDQLRGLL
jgi:hypothetical protein